MVPESMTNRRVVRRNPEAVAIGSLFLLLLAVYAWAMWITRVGYGPFRTLTTLNLDFVLSNRIRAFVLPAFVTNIVGIGFGAWVYAWTRGIDIHSGPPSGNRLRTAILALLAVPLLVAITVLMSYVAFEVPVSSMARSPRYAPETRLSSLVLASFVPSLFAGVGYGLAFFGVVQQRLREVTTPHHAFVLTPLLVGFFWEVRGGVRRVIQLNTPLPTVAVILLTLAAGIAFGSSLGLLYRGTFRASVEHLLRARYVPILAFGLFGVVAVVASIAELPTGPIDALRLVVFGVAAYGYERTRSIWVPILVVAMFPATLDFASYLEATTGLLVPL